MTGRLATVLLLLAWGGWGCSQAPPPTVLGAGADEPAVAEAQASATEAGEAAEEPTDAGSGDEAETPSPETEPAEPAADPADPADRNDATVILIERGESREPRPRTLYEASAAARATRSKAPAARISVTDENLHEYQGEGVTIMTAEAENEAGPGEAETGEAGAAAAAPARGEAYWRTRVRDLRLALREAVDGLVELEGRAGALRRSFYAADDPHLRDGEIKPAWDRTLDRIAETREAIARRRVELAEAIDEGRAAGALPGWLREGIEIEPDEHEYPQDPERYYQPGEPQILDIREPPP